MLTSSISPGQMTLQGPACTRHAQVPGLKLKKKTSRVKDKCSAAQFLTTADCSNYVNVWNNAQVKQIASPQSEILYHESLFNDPIDQRMSVVTPMVIFMQQLVGCLPSCV